MSTELRKLERTVKVHPSLVSWENHERVAAYQKRKTHAKMLRQLQKCQKDLSDFVTLIDNEKIRSALKNSVESLADGIWTLGEFQFESDDAVKQRLSEKRLSQPHPVVPNEKG